ncbi:SURF1 family protein [Orientia chuto str. Dubai]|uniref:SURF1-like protein n=1 Tax=Orientia chuto str. Dubai TaxID=1359168 RepID=A0A0F3MJZ9_9RICK|nr:SURF1 family protein [Candidatus Orientia mediorientalis]KJV55792.1 SURF1 family protein [Orientia chuto str. Dubai]
MFIKRLIPIVFTAIVAISFCTLGVWQIYRLNMKNELLSKVINDKESIPVDLNKVFNLSSRHLLFSKAKVKGHFLAGKDILLYGRYKEKYTLASALLTNEGNIIIVVRGAIADDCKEDVLKKDAIDTKQDVEIEGIMIELEKQKAFFPSNNLKSNVWLTLDKGDVINHIGQQYVNKISDFYLLQTNPSQDNSQITPLQTNLKDRIQNNHLQYALIWFCLAIIVLVIYYIRFHINYDSI